ncbi:MAG: proline--tRNA ligase, partial [Firmicutes bacterium]|nr:proline--tRNA ligase [Bacillota bacterium]
IEAMMKDGKALQAGTSHFLGQNFAKSFEIKFLDKDNQQKYVHTTSWGASTRLIGAMVMVHGDDRGLAVPPRMAPVQVIMIPVGPPKLREKVMAKFDPTFDALKIAGVRVKSDLRDETPGWKFNEWEMRGVPIRLEIGPRDVDNNQVVLARRDTGEKITAPLDGIVDTIKTLLDEIQANMYQRAVEFRNANSHLELETLADLQAHIAKADAENGYAGWALFGWCGSDECEAKVKEETKFTSRNIPFEPPVTKHKCVTCGSEAKHTVWFARAY